MSAEVFIPLTRGKVAVIDFSDFEKVRDLNWQALRGSKTWYAVTTVERRQIYMHRLLMSAGKNQLVDHKDGDGLNNRRQENLRFATNHQNHQNRSYYPVGSSRFKGVYFHKPAKKWVARISLNNKTTHVGIFEDEEDAARAYDSAARRHYGEFARPNFP